MGSGYLRSDLVSVSGVLVLGVLILVYRIPNLTVKRKEVIPRILDTSYEVRLHHKIGKGISKRRNASVHEELRGSRLARVKEKAGARVCVVCRGYTTHEEERGNSTFVCVIGFRPVVFEPAPPG